MQTNCGYLLALGNSPMSKIFRFAKRARFFGTLLSIAEEDKRQRDYTLETMRSTMNTLQQSNPTFNRRMFVEIVAQSAYPTDPRKRLALLEELHGILLKP